jgi:hypothetical protein
MGVFSFFRKPKNKLADSLIPKICLTPIPNEISSLIEKIKWADYETAYGNAKNTIPFYLKNLFCKDSEIAMDATHQLWCSLCHQHAFISPASLPAYDILKIGLLKLDDKFKIEILDIFQGFSDCTSNDYFTNTKQSPEIWELELRQKLISDIDIFKELSSNNNEEISHFATTISEGLLNAS